MAFVSALNGTASVTTGLPARMFANRSATLTPQCSPHIGQISTVAPGSHPSRRPIQRKALVRSVTFLGSHPAQAHTTPMSLLTLQDLRRALGSDQRLIGIDPGSKVIGLALSDVRLTLATPYGSLKRGKLTANAIEIGRIALKEGAGGLVVGSPLSMDGSFGPAAQAARDWTRDLSQALGLPAALWDERMSSTAVNRFMVEEADLTRKKRAEAVDRAAAAWMLQAALDASQDDAPASDPSELDPPD